MMPREILSEGPFVKVGKGVVYNFFFDYYWISKIYDLVFTQVPLQMRFNETFPELIEFKSSSEKQKNISSVRTLQLG
jgi:hypothetical protein